MSTLTAKQQYGYIYCIKNTLDGMCYVGKSSRPVGSRWREHIKAAVSGKKSKLYDAMREQGFKNFEFKVVEQCLGTNEELDLLEVKHIHEFNAHKNGYNGDIGGTGRKQDKAKKSSVVKILGVTRGRKPVMGRNLKTGKLTTYMSLTEAAAAVGGQGSKISNVAMGKAKTAYGHAWSWSDG